ncbi:N-6 DNA methylase [Selenomonas ruminantium]|uniref:N-6 DNA methylase n=1 Tax=Selenomonas ruminantium TaxID=971 RepID=UPI00040C576C|nr:N-6 DNA methylase [Selenomonas ruminantium]
MAVKTAKPVFFPTLSKDDIRKLRESVSYELAWEGMNLLRSKSEPNLAKFMSLVTLAYIYKRIGGVSRERLYDVLRETEMDYSVGLKLNSVLDEFYTEAETLAYKCSEEQLLSLIFGNLSWYFRSMGKRSGSVATPEAFAHIGRELLQVKPGESVMDYCFGFGDFAIGAYLNTKAKAVYGTEISTDAVIVSKIRAAFMDEAISVKQGDSLLDDLSADKIYADPPMAMRETNAYHWRPQDAELAKIYERLPRTRRMDWAFALSALEKQNSGGRTVVLTYDSLLFRASRGEQDIRRYLIDSGLLESVIALPDGIMPNTGVQCDMLVFSQGNTTVRMVDARDCKVKERYTSEMTKDNILEVLRRVNGATEHSRDVEPKEIAEQEYDLSPVGYLSNAVAEVENGVALGDLVLLLERGQAIPASKLEKLATKDETNFQYLMLKDVEDDAVRMPLPYLAEMEESWERFCVTEGNLVISRSAPMKIGIVPPLQGKKVLANGNMYFMQLDEKMVHPIYVMCYLKSREGAKQIEYLSKGSTIKIISRKDLLQVKIPVIPMDEQMKVVEKYTSIRRHLSVLKRQTQELELQLACILEEAD